MIVQFARAEHVSPFGQSHGLRTREVAQGMKIEPVDQDTQEQAYEIGKLEHECIHESLPGGYRYARDACFEEDDCKGSADQEAEIQ